MENFIYSYSLPLPPFEHIGTLNIQRLSGIGSRTKLMSLPVEDRRLSVKVLVNHWFYEIKVMVRSDLHRSSAKSEMVTLNCSVPD